MNDETVINKFLEATWVFDYLH